MESFKVRCPRCKCKFVMKEHQVKLKVDCPKCLRVIEPKPLLNTSEVESKYEQMKRDLGWPEWSTHYCEQCENHIVPDAVKEGGEDNFAPVMNLANPVSSLLVSSVFSGALNAITRTEEQTHVFCPVCKKPDPLNRETAAFYDLAPDEREVVLYTALVNEISMLCDERRTQMKNYRNCLMLVAALMALMVGGAAMASDGLERGIAIALAAPLACSVVYYSLRLWTGKRSLVADFGV